MTAPVIIVTPAGRKVAVRVVPPARIDRDRAFDNYALARTYADAVRSKLGEASMDDRCAWKEPRQ